MWPWERGVHRDTRVREGRPLSSQDPLAEWDGRRVAWDRLGVRGRPWGGRWTGWLWVQTESAVLLVLGHGAERPEALEEGLGLGWAGAISTRTPPAAPPAHGLCRVSLCQALAWGGGQARKRSLELPSGRRGWTHRETSAGR